jgi:hypothetical protein
MQKKEVHIMENENIIDMLNNIEEYINKEEYEQAINYIQRKKAEIKIDNDSASRYIDELTKDLK